MNVTIGLELITVAILAFLLAKMWLGKVSPEKAHDLVKHGARLVDVRTPAEFSRGHLDGALNIPIQELASRIGDVGAKDVPVIVYCASGVRSASARSILKAAGFEVHDLGAMHRWG